MKVYKHAQHHFERLADWASVHIGGFHTFLAALAAGVFWVIFGWRVVEPVIVSLTFLFVFLIQNAQNRHDKAIHIKLNEIIHTMKDARNEVMDVEDAPEAQLDEIMHEFKIVAKHERGEDELPERSSH